MSTDAVRAALAELVACHTEEAGLMAPDGRCWMNADPMILFAALAAVMRGEVLRFGDQ